MAALTTGKAAARLGVSKPTVRAWIGDGLVRARREKRGQGFRWLIDEEEIARPDVRTLVGRAPRRRPSRLAQLESDVASLQEALRTAGPPAVPSESPPGELQRERDDLRAKVVGLEETIVRLRAAAEMQGDADAHRSTVIEH